jgi:hypothetical protein
MAALAFFEDLHEKKCFPRQFLSSTTIAACLQAVRLDRSVDSRPPTIKMEPEYAIVEKYLQAAQEELVNIVDTNAPRIWPHLPKFTETFHQSALSFQTSMVKNISAYAATYLRMVIRADVHETPSVHESIFRRIVRGKQTDDKENVPFLESPFIMEMVKEHHTWLQDAFTEGSFDFDDGILHKTNVNDRPHLFLAYQLFLAKRLDAGTADKTKTRQRATFQIIPQLTMKRRSVTFGQEQTMELLYHLARKDQAGDFVKDMNPWQPSRLPWSKDLGLFLPPSGLRKSWTGVVSTDGIVASWSTVPSTTSFPERRSEKKIVYNLQNKLYEKHGVDGTLFKLKEPFNIIAVDPGLADLLHCVRLHQTEPLCSPPNEDHSISSRRRAKIRFLAERNMSTFKVTNKQFTHNMGLLKAINRTHDLHEKLELQPSIDILATATSKTASLERYLLHVVARVKTAPTFMKLMRIKCTSRWKFESHLTKNHVVKQISKDLLGGMSPETTLVVWGDGCEDDATNKMLRKLLSRHMPIVIGTEYNTSKLSNCCHVETTKLVSNGYTGRGTVVTCNGCQKLLKRDENAAHNILHIFQHQYTHEGEVPAAFRPVGKK